MSDTKVLSTKASVSTFGYQGGFEASGPMSPLGMLIDGGQCAPAGHTYPSYKQLEPYRTDTLPNMRTLYAHKVPQSPAIEYFRAPDDEDDDIATSADTSGEEIIAAIRDVGVMLHFKSVGARARGEDTRQLIRPECPLLDGCGKVWIGQLKTNVTKHLGSARTFSRSFEVIRQFALEVRRAQLTEKLDAMHKLKKGWNSYTASPPNSAAIENAKALVTTASNRDIIPERVEPSAMGGVGVTFTAGEREVVVEFYNDGTAHSLFADNGTEEMDTQPVEVTRADYAEFLNKVRQYLYAQHRTVTARRSNVS